MKWNKYSIQTTTQAIDFISCMLGELGIEGIEIEDNIQLTQQEAKTMFVDFIPDLPPDDGLAKVHFYIDVEEDDKSILDKVKNGLEELRAFVDIGEGTLTESQTEDKDWINNWKQYWHTFMINDLYIKPTWEPVTDEMKNHPILSIDPGTAFGTGSHETTKLVIKQLQKYVKPKDKVLDVGCGSGILSIAALKLGAREVVGTDLDADCMVSTRDNMEVNRLDAALGTFYVGNLIDDEKLQEQMGTEEYEIVVANILAPVIIAMAPVIFPCLKK